MGEGKWIKTYVNTYDDTPSKMIDANENRDAIHYIRGRLLALAGKVNRNGELYMTETKPYTIKTLAIEFNRDFEVVKEAIKVLKSLDVIEITENRTFKISDWEIEQNVEGLERIRKQTNERVARHRAAKKAAEDSKQAEEENKPKGIKKSEEDNKEKESKDSSDEEDRPDVKLDCLEEVDNKFESNASYDNQELNNIEEKINEKDIILEDNIINNIDSKCNATVTQENKTRGKKRSKKKDKRESKKKENNNLIEFSCDNNDFEIGDDNSEYVFAQSFVTENLDVYGDVGDDSNAGSNGTIIFEVSESNNHNELAITDFKISDSEHKSEESAKILLKYCNDIATCIPENITFNALQYAVKTHTEKYVKMAIDKSIEVGKFNMSYINGILKNWKREGYPRKNESEGGNINGANSYGKSIITDTIKFEGFKPKKPRELNEEERIYAEKNLI